MQNASKCKKIVSKCKLLWCKVHQSVNSITRDRPTISWWWQTNNPLYPQKTLKGQIKPNWRGVPFVCVIFARSFWSSKLSNCLLLPPLFVAIAHELLWAMLPKTLSMRDVVLSILNFEDTPTPISTKRFQKPIVAISLVKRPNFESTSLSKSSSKWK